MAWQSVLDDSDLTGSLREAVETVETTLDSRHLEFRQWLEKQSNITWLTDDDFLGAFSSGDHTDAQNRILKLLTSQKEHSQWFENLDPADPDILKVFDEGYLILLPDRDDNGRQMHIARFGVDSSKVDAVSWMRAVVVFFNYQFLINYKDNTGLVAILDLANTTVESFDAVMPLDVLREWCLILDSHYPGQFTNLHFLNGDEKVRETIVEVIKGGFPVKLTESKIHSDTLEELYKDVPMRCLPLEYLPADYTGPSAGTLQQVIEYTKSTLTNPEVRERIVQLSQDQWNINDESQETPADQPSSDA